MASLLDTTPPLSTGASQEPQGRDGDAAAAAGTGIGLPVATGRPCDDGPASSMINPGNTTALAHSRGTNLNFLTNTADTTTASTTTTNTTTNTAPVPSTHHRWISKPATENSPKMYTTSFAFFEALWDAGVTHAFVNLGSDHPSIIEAMVKGAREKKGQFPRIITCPNEVG